MTEHQNPNVWQLPPLVLEASDITTAVKSYVQEIQQHCGELGLSDAHPSEVILFRTAAMDYLMTQLYAHADKISREQEGRHVNCCLVSQGGYGRRELCLYSDLDLLFLYEGKAHGFIKVLTETILRPLWDSGLEIGFATRTVRDCRQMMEDDLTIFTSLLDARWLAGSESLFDEFCKMYQRYVVSEKNQQKFVKLKMEENNERERRYADPVYLLEPQIKEGKGGLRDYHTLHWLSRMSHGVQHPKDLVRKGVLRDVEFEELWEGINFLWRIRNELHRFSERKNDWLTFEYQDRIAQRLGFHNTDHFLGVELFMQKYHQHTASIDQICGVIIRQISPIRPKLFPPPQPVDYDANAMVVGTKLTIKNSDVFEKNPLYLLQIFESERRSGLELDHFTLDKIRENLHRIDDSFRSDPASGALFRKILSEPKGLNPLLTHMHETRVLGTFLPEFAKLLFRVQHDIYHVYTVDIHSLYAVGEMERLAVGEATKQYPTPSLAIKDVRDFSVLSFAILYHDIGKGEGSGHVVKGAPLIRRAAERLGYSREEVELLEFLELSHLIMTHLAFRRDLEEQNLAIQFARSMQTTERLTLLYLLTFCDVKGVSPEAMTDWKASLLEYLYLRTREVLLKGAFAPERASTLIPLIKTEVLQLTGSEVEREKCEVFLNMMAARYLLSTPPHVIYRHLQLWKKFEQDPIAIERRFLEKERLTELTLLTLNHPALFSKVTCVLAAHRINILNAEIAISSAGHALLTFSVTDAEGKPMDDEPRWVRFDQDLREILQGKIPLRRFVEENFAPSFLQKKVARRLPARIEVDNDVSAYYTVIDIYAHDRVGLLYQITSTLEALGLYVDVSKISTKVDQISDVFYVRDIFGHKITSKEKLAHISQTLMKSIDEGEGV